MRILKLSICLLLCGGLTAPLPVDAQFYVRPEQKKEPQRYKKPAVKNKDATILGHDDLSPILGAPPVYNPSFEDPEESGAKKYQVARTSISKGYAEHSGDASSLFSDSFQKDFGECTQEDMARIQEFDQGIANYDPANEFQDLDEDEDPETPQDLAKSSKFDFLEGMVDQEKLEEYKQKFRDIDKRDKPADLMEELDPSDLYDGLTTEKIKKAKFKDKTLSMLAGQTAVGDMIKSKVRCAFNTPKVPPADLAAQDQQAQEEIRKQRFRRTK